MGPLIFMARRHQIKRRKSNLQYRLMQVSNQRQQIAARMGEANQRKALNQSIYTVMNQFNQNLQRQSMFQRMQEISNAIGKSKNPDTQKRALQMEMDLLRFNLFNNINDNAFLNQMNDTADQAELAQLHVIDSQLEQEQVSLENQLKLLEAEEQAVEKQMDQEIKNSAPKFGLSG